MNSNFLRSAFQNLLPSDVSEITETDVDKLDLGRAYDDAFDDPYETLAWKDHFLLYTIFSFFLIFLVWSNVSKIDEITRGEGKITPSSKIQIVQNLEGGIIEAILVKEGETVQEGQPVLRMKNIEASADYKANLAQYMGIKASIARLEAELSTEEPDFPEELHQSESKGLISSEMAAYKANVSRYNDQSRIVQQQLDQKRQEVKELNKRISGAQKVLALSLEEKHLLETLVARGAASKYELLQLESKVAEQSSALDNLKTALPRVHSAAREAKERIQEHKSNYQANTQAELTKQMVELNTVKETLAAYEDRNNRTEVTSPVDGIVKEIKISTIGGVVRPGQDLMDIVPLNDVLIIEAHIRPSDIAFIYSGQKATVKVTAYDYALYGTLDAVVKDISADTIIDSNGNSFYRVKLEKDGPLPQYKGKELKIMPGMITSVDIITGKKTIMSYLLKPFMRTISDG